MTCVWNRGKQIADNKLTLVGIHWIEVYCLLYFIQYVIYSLKCFILVMPILKVAKTFNSHFFSIFNVYWKICIELVPTHTHLKKRKTTYHSDNVNSSKECPFQNENSLWALLHNAITKNLFIFKTKNKNFSVIKTFFKLVLFWSHRSTVFGLYYC